MKYLRNIDTLPYVPSTKRAVFDAVMGFATAGTNLASNLIRHPSMTNDANKEIADKNNQTAIRYT